MINTLTYASENFFSNNNAVKQYERINTMLFERDKGYKNIIFRNVLYSLLIGVANHEKLEIDRINYSDLYEKLTSNEFLDFNNYIGVCIKGAHVHFYKIADFKGGIDGFGISSPTNSDALPCRFSMMNDVLTVVQDVDNVTSYDRIQYDLLGLIKIG